ncbi:MAG: hypothetical protein R2800_13695 [Flavipsychrobacter sp.]
MEDKKIFEKLVGMKWGNSFCCAKCGFASYVQGKSQFSRKCKNTKCRYEESLKKYTVFDGLNIPIPIGCNILLDIFNVSRVYFDTDLKIIGNNGKEYENLGHYIDERKKVEEAGVQNFEKFVTEETVQKYIAKYRRESSVKNLSTKYSIEESTIIKFLDRINERIPLSVKEEKATSYERLIEVFCHLYEWDITQFYKLIITPTPERCHYGSFIAQKRLYGFDFDNQYYSREEEDFISDPIVCKAETKDFVFTETMYYKGQKVAEEEIEEIHYEITGEEIVYGSDEWKTMFGIR